MNFSIVSWSHRFSSTQTLKTPKDSRPVSAMGREFKSMTEMISTKGYGIMRKATSHVKDDNQVMLQFSAVAESGLKSSKYILTQVWSKDLCSFFYSLTAYFSINLWLPHFLCRRRLCFWKFWGCSTHTLCRPELNISPLIGPYTFVDLNVGMSRSDPQYLSDIGPERWIRYRWGEINMIRSVQRVTW